MNRLAGERSPYLLQHANNPVDWYAWGEDAFARARREDKPIFLSVGYSTCHWCHVMEHESFEDPAIAALLNEHFVSIKVDREERPDVDRVYMTFVQGTTGSGGWPMSVWLTPELKPFYGGTYFPPTARWNRPGFVDVLRELHRAWTQNRDRIEQSARSMLEQLQQVSRGTPGSVLPGPQVLSAIASQFRRSFDERHAGFGEAPKFPRPAELLFLLREYVRTGDSTARDMVLRTLEAMALGGMRDQIGGGFHRYSVDPAWRVPHFEKMLYDQAQLAIACLEAAQASGDAFYRDVAEDTLQYVMREMTGEGGGFFSAEDADSIPPEQVGNPGAHKMEGAFYLWRDAELDELLGPQAEIVKRRFGVSPDGNAPVDPQQEFVGKNLLHVARSIADLAEESRRPADEIESLLRDARLRLFEARSRRPRPHLDDKVLTAWNGLMIAAFARAARLARTTSTGVTPGGSPYLDAARRAATFIRDSLWQPAGRGLLRRYREGHADIAGYAEDYAFLIQGLIELFQADPRAMWLEWAVALQHRQDELFWDDDNGGWFSTSGQDPTVLLRVKEDYDGAEPSASAVSVLNLLALSHLHQEPAWTERIERTLRLFGQKLEQMGRAVPMMASALATYLSGVQQVVIIGDGPEALALEAVAASRYRPFTLVLPLSPGEQPALGGVAPFLASLPLVNGRPAAYLCREFSCRTPVTDQRELAAALDESPGSTGA